MIERLGMKQGPWYWTFSEDEGSLYPPSPDGIYAANEGILEYVPRNTSLMEKHKDLIATSPEMWEALIDSIRFMMHFEHYMHGYDKEMDLECSVTRRKAIRAVEKATGLTWEKLKEIVDEER